MKRLLCCILFPTLIYGNTTNRSSHAKKFGTFQVPILFPKNRPSQTDSYVCTSVSVERIIDSLEYIPSSSLYVEAFTPVAEMSVVHHMLLHGCIVPGKPTGIWNCGAMLERSSIHKDNLPVAEICSDGVPRILYAWARNAPSLELPEKVAFEIGGYTEIQSLVLQIHSGDHTVDHMAMTSSSNKSGVVDNDVGVILHVSVYPSPKLAGVYFLGTGGAIQPRRIVHLESGCLLKEDKELHPFAFRTHSHSLGKVISGYRVRKRPQGGQFEWTLIGKKDPQLPQMFYPVENVNLVVRPGDILAARCTMESNRTRMTKIGPTAGDEMCNFYIMYYVNEGSPLENDRCYNFGPQFENFWEKSSLGLNNFPGDASVLK